MTMHTTPGNMQKEILWQQEETKFLQVRDRLGKGIDAGILETVIVLNLLGIYTTQSCEGHIDWGKGGPWIIIEEENMEELDLQVRNIFTQVHQEDRHELYDEAHKLRLLAKAKHTQNGKKLIEYLAQFYRGREVPYDRHLIIQEVDWMGKNLVQCQGTDLYETAPRELRQQKLTEYQQEMHAFTNFLKERFFSLE